MRKPVFDNLFDPRASEILPQPGRGVRHAPGTPVTFATVLESARRRGETAIGYRDATRWPGRPALVRRRHQPGQDRPVALGTDDRVIVFAAEAEARPG